MSFQSASGSAARRWGRRGHVRELDLLARTASGQTVTKLPSITCDITLPTYVLAVLVEGERVVGQKRGRAARKLELAQGITDRQRLAAARCIRREGHGPGRGVGLC